MEYEIKRCSRQCAVTERQLQPGETFYSVLTVEGAEVARTDYSSEAWEGPPEGVLGWWQAVMPDRDASKPQWAPNDVMLNLFEELEQDPTRHDMRYVLTLLLVRRRVMRLEETSVDEQGREVLVVYCGKRDQTYHVPVVSPGPQRTDEIQQALAELLFADAA